MAALAACRRLRGTIGAVRGVWRSRRPLPDRQAGTTTCRYARTRPAPAAPRPRWDAVGHRQECCHNAGIASHWRARLRRGERGGSVAHEVVSTLKKSMKPLRKSRDIIAYRWIAFQTKPALNAGRGGSRGEQAAVLPVVASEVRTWSSVRHSCARIKRYRRQSRTREPAPGWSARPADDDRHRRQSERVDEVSPSLAGRRRQTTASSRSQARSPTR